MLALQFLTRLPMSSTRALGADAVAIGLVRATSWFPLVGTLIGCITAAIALAAAQIWLAIVAVFTALAVEAWLTGAFHEDAVADFCDGFGGGRSADDVRRIMKDSRIGSYGTLGLLLAVGLRAVATAAAITTLDAALAAATIIGAATFGRWLVVVLMVIIEPAPGGGGLAKDVAGEVGMRGLGLATLTAVPGLLALAVMAPLSLLASCVAAGLFLVWFRGLLLRRIGGSTGDCLGFAAYVGQLMVLMVTTAQ